MTEVHRPNQIDQFALDYLRSKKDELSGEVPTVYESDTLEYRLTQNIDFAIAEKEVKYLAGTCKKHNKLLKLSAQNLTDFAPFWKLADLKLFDIITTPDHRKRSANFAEMIKQAKLLAEQVILGVDVFRKKEDHEAIAKDFAEYKIETQQFTWLTKDNAYKLRQFRDIYGASRILLGGLGMHPLGEHSISVPVIAKLGETAYVSTSEFVRQPVDGGLAIPNENGEYLLVTKKSRRQNFTSYDDNIMLGDDFPATVGMTPAQIGSACDQDTKLRSRLRRCKETWRLKAYESILNQQSVTQIRTDARLATILQRYSFL